MESGLKPRKRRHHCRIEEAIESNPDLVRRIKDAAAATGPRMSAEEFFEWLTKFGERRLY
jgi:hypothetical protein